MALTAWWCGNEHADDSSLTTVDTEDLVGFW